MKNRIKKGVTALLLAALVLGGAGCAGGPGYEALRVAEAAPLRGYGFDDIDARRAVREENPVEDSFLWAVNQFGFETASQILSGAQGNALYSPLSLYYALALAASGARGQTQQELLALLCGAVQAPHDEAVSDGGLQIYNGPFVGAPRILRFGNGLYAVSEEPAKETPDEKLGEGTWTASGETAELYVSQSGAMLVRDPESGNCFAAAQCGADYTAGGIAVQAGNFYRTLYTDNKIAQLRLSNSLWLKQEVPFEQAFLDTAAKEYYASIFSADFSDPGTGEAIAGWLEDNTGGTVDASFSPDPQQVMALFNTVYFRDQWIDRFDKAKTAPDAFHPDGGGAVTCDFMNAAYGSHNFARGGNFTRSALGLKGTGSMVFILPDEGVRCDELLASAQSVQEIFFGGQEKYGEVIWQIPKFGFGDSIAANEALQALGVRQAFSPDADFSAVAQDTLFLSSVTQNTHISIDEQGVEAAAFTQIDYAGAAPPDGRAEMILDRPFIFGIVDGGVLLFVGVCADPTA